MKSAKLKIPPDGRMLAQRLKSAVQPSFHQTAAHIRPVAQQPNKHANVLTPELFIIIILFQLCSH